MKGTLVLCSLVLWFGVEAYGQNNANPVESQRTLINQYCAGCHNNNVKSGGCSWTDVDLTHLEKSPDRVEKVIRKVRSGMMPPSGAKRPDAPALKAFAASLERSMDQAAVQQPYIDSP